MNAEKELRIIDACERGAVGVDRGHKWAALFRGVMTQIKSGALNEQFRLA